MLVQEKPMKPSRKAVEALMTLQPKLRFPFILTNSTNFGSWQNGITENITLTKPFEKLQSTWKKLAKNFKFPQIDRH